MLPSPSALIRDSSIIKEHMQALFVPCHNHQVIVLTLHPFYQMLKKMKISRVVQIEKHPLFAALLIHQGSCAQQTYRIFLSLHE